MQRERRHRFVRDNLSHAPIARSIAWTLRLRNEIRVFDARPEVALQLLADHPSTLKIGRDIFSHLSRMTVKPQ
jgi:hypothetical protein